MTWKQGHQSPTVEAPWPFTQAEFNEIIERERGHLTMPIIEIYFEEGMYVVVDDDGTPKPLIDAVKAFHTPKESPADANN